MVSKSRPKSSSSDRRSGDRRQDEKPFAGQDRRVGPRRSGADRRRDPRD